MNVPGWGRGMLRDRLVYLRDKHLAEVAEGLSRGARHGAFSGVRPWRFACRRSRGLPHVSYTAGTKDPP